ncbi:MAG: U32 family peptidase [Elusimicrobiota bacterium]|jgi:hypothetical protein
MKPCFSIPFNGDLRLLRDALSSGKVSEVYFQGPSAADLSTLTPPRRTSPTRRALRQMIGECGKRQVKTNLLCNAASLFFFDFRKALRFLKTEKGIDAITVSDPYAARLFRQELPNHEIHASIVMGLDSAAKVSAAAGLGISEVNLSLCCNRDLEVLRAVRSLKRRLPGMRTRLIANHPCPGDCVFMPWHWLLDTFKDVFPDSSSFREGAPYRYEVCMRPHTTAEELLHVPFIRPEDCAFYVREGYADVIKLAFRDMPSERLRDIYDAYFSGRRSGDLWRIVDVSLHDGKKAPACDNSRFPKGFLQHVLSCGKDCPSCGYCARLAKRVMGQGS